MKYRLFYAGGNVPVLIYTVRIHRLHLHTKCVSNEYTFFEQSETGTYRDNHTQNRIRSAIQNTYMSKFNPYRKNASPICNSYHDSK